MIDSFNSNDYGSVDHKNNFMNLIIIEVLVILYLK